MAKTSRGSMRRAARRYRRRKLGLSVANAAFTFAGPWGLPGTLLTQAAIGSLKKSRERQLSEMMETRAREAEIT